MPLLFIVGLVVACGHLAAAEPLLLRHVEPHLFDVAPKNEEGPYALKLWSNRIAAYMEFSDYKGLEGWCDDYTRDKTREKDGMWVISRMYAGFSNYFTGVSAPQDGWGQAYRQIAAWRAKYPNSMCAPVVEAIYWKRYAWQARGGGYADTVTAEGWKLFHARLQKGVEVLLANKQLAAKTPHWSFELLELTRGLGWSEQRRQAIFEQGVAHFPRYAPLYFEHAYADTPRWYGNWQLVEADAEAAVKATHATMGQAMYARIYWNLFSELDGNLNFALFDDTQADWVRMRSGFGDLMVRHPGSVWNLNAYAAFSCMAGDFTTYKKLRPRIRGDSYYQQAWPGNFSIDVCDQSAAHPNGSGSAQKGEVETM